MARRTASRGDRIDEAARVRWGWDRLRPPQREAIEAALEGRDVLAVMPTGSGKSAIYQVAATLVPGITVVVSPLIALQQDQLAGIEDAPDAPRATVINSHVPAGRLEESWRDIEAGEIEYVLLAPEQLVKEDVLARLKRAEVSLLAIDEAHCVSVWGHDFRPDYLELGTARRALGNPPVIALTATGSAPVRDDIIARLGMNDPLVIATGFDRRNIRLSVERHTTASESRQAVLDDIVALPKPGLLYVATRADTTRYAEALEELGITALGYHGGMSARDRKRAHERFRDDEVEVVVATAAFGMGIDKPNVRFVVHAAVPDSLDAYYQEVGRSGRDGQDAQARLHYRPEDLGLRRFFAAKNPSAGQLRRVIGTLQYADAVVSVADLAERLELTRRRVGGLLDLVEQAGRLRRSARGVRLRAGADVEEVVAEAIAAAEQRERIDGSRIEMMRGYAETDRCRREVLLAYFGEEFTPPCDRCDVCERGSGPEHHEADGPFAVQSAVRHALWGDGTVMSTEDDRITVYFEAEGYKVLSLDAIEEHDLLEQV
ncbi:RecQ family ATP-dependent DNA helicase [Diaminobutyricimonas aerilata]|nr:RecQ family ATP-dependent DNA helicase [Diaminobutyricimonas aerilata]